MGLFKNNPFGKAAAGNTPAGVSANPHFATISAGYRRLLSKHPFLSFGLPFITAIVSGSFFLTPATAIRYEKFDRKTHTIDRDQALGMGFRSLGQPSKPTGDAADADEERKTKRPGGRFQNKDIREEYWKLAGRNDKLDDWEPVRVQRKPGELDGTFD